MVKYLQSNNNEENGGIITINLTPNQYLSDAFTSIPSNANIHKGRCGIGGTTMELNDSRHSAIVVPNISIMLDKKKVYKDMICIYGDTSIAEITYQLDTFFKDNPRKHLKVMSTPDSFHKFITASFKTGFDVFNECFMLLDESHSIATEGTYRQNITRPFDYFFQFKHKSIMSATPYGLSDPRFNDLKGYKVETQHLNNKINVVFSDSILATLKSFAQQAREQENVNLHIFYNSVFSIASFLNLIGTGGDDVNIFCASNDENIGKLDEFSVLLKNMDDCDELPKKKINLYTTKYYEGWDLKDENAVLIIVSDVAVEHTCIGITNKAVQAVGRLRNKALGVYHITNTFNNDVILSNEKIIAICRDDIQKKIDYYNYTLTHFAFKDQTGWDIIAHVKGLIEEFSTIDPDSQSASLNYNKFDAVVNNRLALAQYNNKETVINAWKEANLDVEAVFSHILMTKRDNALLSNKRRGAAKKNKLIFEKLRDLEQNQQNFLTADEYGNRLFNLGRNDEFDKLKNSYPDLYKYYTTLGFDKAKELKFNKKKLNLEYLNKTASEIEVSKELKTAIGSCFKQGNFYSSSFTKKQLSDIFRSFGINRTVTGADINKYFVTEETTRRIDSITTKGYQLVIERV